jgi:dihydrodiol dehydrogenase / D-xylose 1-dehydrogenase (NADP)
MRGKASLALLPLILTTMDGTGAFFMREYSAGSQGRRSKMLREGRATTTHEEKEDVGYPLEEDGAPDPVRRSLLIAGTGAGAVLPSLGSEASNEGRMPTSGRMSPPPRPLDDPSASDPLDCPPLKWGLIGCGRVSHDFAQALKLLPTASVVACAAHRDPDRAAAFAARHGIPASYGSYDDLIADDGVEIAYVGTVQSFRRSVGEKCLLAGKHVLLEKPFACNFADAMHLANLASERNLFLSEGMWTRYFPAVQQARRLVVQQRIVGDVVSVLSDFNFNAAKYGEDYPSSFFYRPDLGGGATLIAGPYPVSAAILFFAGVVPDSVKATGQVDDATGADLQASVSLSFPATDGTADTDSLKPAGSGVASLSYGFLGDSEERTVVVGTKGWLTIHSPSHCPTHISVTIKDISSEAQELHYHYPLPPETNAIKTAGGFNYPNSAGFSYEAAAIARCIAADKTETPQNPMAETLIEMKVLDEIRKQLGVKEPII